MTQLQCMAQTCMYNQDRYCSKGEIVVEGRDAKAASGTCCGSFRERTSDMKNSVAGHPSKNIDVDCQAVSCTYNKECKCTAKNIGIAGAQACGCQDTECLTFTTE